MEKRRILYTQPTIGASTKLRLEIPFAEARPMKLHDVFQGTTTIDEKVEQKRRFRSPDQYENFQALSARAKKKASG